MAVTLTGVLKDPYGQPLPGATIRFDAVRTSATVLNHIRAEAITDAQGDYSISVEVGRYDVRVMQGRSFLELAKNLEVRADSTATDLNELVVEWQGEQDLTPGIVIEFRALVDEARGYRDEAVASAGEAAASESNAADSASAANESASNAATSEHNAANSASAASALASSASDSADAASTSEANAASSASAAAASEGNAATSASNAASAASAAVASESNAAGSESAAAASEADAAQSATDAAASAASIDAADLVHAPGSGLPNEAGDIYSRNAAEFDAAGSAASAESAAKSYADTKASEAQAHAVQRSNHTGTQTLSTISDAGTAAAKNVGTVAGNVMEVGAFGLGIAEGWTVDSLNIDELKTAGIFSFSGSAGTPPPWFAGEGGTVVVSRHGGAFVTQVATAGGSGKMAVRTGGGPSFSWDEWRLIYTSNSIVSSVYDTGGIPGGGVFEVGYNTNGSFLKLADGTLICVFTGTRDIYTTTASGSLFRSPSGIVWTFPSAFHTVPYSSFEYRRSGSLIWFVSDDTGSKTQMSMYAMSPQSGSYAEGFFRAFAIGRWK
ncbi:prophage tail fiber N-terminal domain-containing protein [Halomonas sp. BN3-1]|uniref:prophage tail fiber N-terminal domain-containing protein n=1 Tax=Halomonas sp. BN3-1 TaxID=2082393 RepID=UPI000D34F54E|nr:prophage tail fiber N-terminal domain-containing protein [Halomonas sp. BN3-1]